MNIQGIQKLTLLDYPEHVACTLFTGGCQLNCPFCHNSELISEPFDGGLDIEEILAFLKKRQGLLDGVCVSGGEPLLQPDIEEFLKQVKALGYQIKLDTNGGFPDRLERIIDSGLIDYVAMDIKNTPSKYALTCGLEEMDLAPYIRSKNLLLENRIDYEFRTTIVQELHRYEDVMEMAKWLSGAKRYYLQCFVSSEQVRDNTLSAYKESVLKKMCEDAKKVLSCTELRGI